MITVANLSGWKDSVAMVLMALERGEQIDHILFADTGAEFPELYGVLDQVETITGRKITRVKNKLDFWEMLPRKGWPFFKLRWCTGELKRDLVRQWEKQLPEKPLHLIGIAADEERRLKPRKNVRYPLAEWGITEAQAVAYCYSRGLTWGGLYEHRPRVSCYCCPLQRNAHLRLLRKTHPDLWAKMLEADKQEACQRYKFFKNETLTEFDQRIEQEEQNSLL